MALGSSNGAAGAEKSPLPPMAPAKGGAVHTPAAKTGGGRISEEDRFESSSPCSGASPFSDNASTVASLTPLSHTPDSGRALPAEAPGATPSAALKVNEGFSFASIPRNIIDFQYAVRGKVLDCALEIEKHLEDYPFDHMVPCHIGNPHAVGLDCMSYVRESLSLLMHPTLLRFVRDDCEVNRDDKGCCGGAGSRVAQFLECADAEKRRALRDEWFGEEAALLAAPIDLLTRAVKHLRAFGDPGGYTHSAGCPGLRQEIADWLEERDGVRPKLDCVYLTNGASDGIDSMFVCLLGSEKDAILVPKPQYPLYTAGITKHGGTYVFYELDEDSGWTVSGDELRARYDEAVASGLNVKALAVICPGNPTPTLMTRAQKVEILHFCHDRNLLLLADEVYQDNIYHAPPHLGIADPAAAAVDRRTPAERAAERAECSSTSSCCSCSSRTCDPMEAAASASTEEAAATATTACSVELMPVGGCGLVRKGWGESSCDLTASDFVERFKGCGSSGWYAEAPARFESFRRVLLEETALLEAEAPGSGMASSASFRPQVASFHSSSKGLVGECGFRGGILCLDNVPDQVLSVLYKLRSLGICSNTTGQACMSLVVHPPRPGDESFPKYRDEATRVFRGLRDRAQLMCNFLCSLPGVSCRPIYGAMYAFPRIHFSANALKAAAHAGQSVQLFYCIRLLEATGIITTPGDGFGEKDGTYHIRITILPELEILIPALKLYDQFHRNFWSQYADDSAHPQPLQAPPAQPLAPAPAPQHAS